MALSSKQNKNKLSLRESKEYSIMVCTKNSIDIRFKKKKCI